MPTGTQLPESFQQQHGLALPLAEGRSGELSVYDLNGQRHLYQPLANGQVRAESEDDVSAVSTFMCKEIN